MVMTEIKYLPEVQAIADEYPGWEAWTSLIGGQWHARPCHSYTEGSSLGQYLCRSVLRRPGALLCTARRL
jgi:hypothetical protein